jgi:hypothetical protein
VFALPVRVVKLHRSPHAAPSDDESSCDADCLVSSCDVLLDGSGRLVGGNTAATSAAFPSVAQVDVQSAMSFNKHFSCVTTESPLMDVGVAVSYNTSGGYGCPMPGYGTPVIVTAEFEVSCFVSLAVIHDAHVADCLKCYYRSLQNRCAMFSFATSIRLQFVVWSRPLVAVFGSSFSMVV